MRFAQTRIQFLLISVLLQSLLVPTVAFAGWGDENWGELVWGGSAAVDAPALSAAGLAMLAVIIGGLSCWLLVTRRRAQRVRRSPPDDSIYRR